MNPKNHVVKYCDCKSFFSLQGARNKKEAFRNPRFFVDPGGPLFCGGAIDKGAERSRQQGEETKTLLEKELIIKSYGLCPKNWRDNYGQKWRLRYSEEELKLIGDEIRDKKASGIDKNENEDRPSYKSNNPTLKYKTPQNPNLPQQPTPKPRRQATPFYGESAAASPRATKHGGRTTNSPPCKIQQGDILK